jgi:hypothetical protein
VAGDAAIGVNDSPDTKVLHNTIVISGTYPNAIEYRFADTTGVTVANNLTDAAIRARDGATANLVGNASHGRTLDVRSTGKRRPAPDPACSQCRQ